MLGGVALFVGTSWDTLSRGARTGLLATFAVAFVIAGIAVAGPSVLTRGRRDDGLGAARRRIAGALFGLATVPAGMATAMAVDTHSLLTGALVALVVAVGGFVLLPSVPGVLATAVTSVVAVAALAQDAFHGGALAAGLALLALGVVWIVLALTGEVAPRPLALTIGAAVALVGAQQPMGGRNTVIWAYVLTLAVAVACFLLYRWRRSVVLLVAGVAGVTLAVPEAVADMANGALSGAAVLLIAGAVLVAASAVGLRLRRADEAARQAVHPR
jgi:hypothetical protein